MQEREGDGRVLRVFVSMQLSVPMEAPWLCGIRCMRGRPCDGISVVVASAVAVAVAAVFAPAGAPCWPAPGPCPGHHQQPPWPAAAAAQQHSEAHPAAAAVTAASLAAADTLLWVSFLGLDLVCA